jgi:hypothetical protein
MLAQPPADESRLVLLKQIGEQLRLSLDMASRCGPGTLGRRAAWSHAEQGTSALGEFVKSGIGLEQAVYATAAKLSRR